MKANETSREELLLRDVKILFDEMNVLRTLLAEEKQETENLRKDIAYLKEKAASRKEERDKEDMAFRFHARSVLKEKRKKYGLSQRELSEMLYMDISFVEKAYNVSVDTSEMALKALEVLESTGKLKPVKTGHYQCKTCNEIAITLSKRPRCKTCGERMTNVYEDIS
jgi:ribosome-binding protein aMBF1 (putative translation factor)